MTNPTESSTQPALWKCPECRVSYKLPAGRRPPERCPECRGKAERRLNADASALAEFLAETDAAAAHWAMPADAPEIPVEFQEAPVVQSLPASFVRVVEAREPTGIAYRAGRWVRRNRLVTAIGVIALCGIAPQWSSSRPGTTVPDKAVVVPEIPALVRLSDARVFELSVPLVRETLVAGKTAVFSPDYLVQWGEEIGDGRQVVGIGGTLRSRNKFGVLTDLTWELTGTALHPQRELEWHEIKLNGISAAMSPAWQTLLHALGPTFGNAVSGQHPDVQSEIDRVAACVDEAAHSFLGATTLHYSWPDDPNRNELMIRIDQTGNWRFDGWVKVASEFRPLKIQGYCERKTGNVLSLYIRDRWVIGTAPE